MSLSFVLQGIATEVAGTYLSIALVDVVTTSSACAYNRCVKWKVESTKIIYGELLEVILRLEIGLCLARSLSATNDIFGTRIGLSN